MISSLDGNDVFAMSRMYQKKYEDELKDYVEVTPPLLLNVAGVTVETGSSSFKEFMILFDKIYEGTKTIGSKKQMDPQTQKSDEIRELTISKFDKEFNIEDAVGVSIAKISDFTGPNVGKIVDKGVIQIQVEEDYLTRVGMYNVIDKKWKGIINYYLFDCLNIKAFEAVGLQVGRDKNGKIVKTRHDFDDAVFGCLVHISVVPDRQVHLEQAVCTR